MKNENLWKISYRNIEVSEDIKSSKYSPLLKKLISRAGIDSARVAENYLCAGEELFADPLLMKGMPKAVERLKRAMDTGEVICVYGDYDVDGITATCVLYDWLKKHGANCSYYIPDRITDGYGLNCGAIDRIKSERRATLIVSVDCGITAIREVEYAKTLGIDFVITDHHECGGDIPVPDAVAVVDLKQEGDDYPCRHLSGVGVALKLISALSAPDYASVLDTYADLAAIGTVADVVPLIGENRFLVKKGLSLLNSNPRPGIKKLLEKSNQGDKSVTSDVIGYIIAPRINATGRVGNPKDAVELLLSEDDFLAEELADKLCALNTRRQEMGEKIEADAVAMLSGYSEGEPIVLADSDWHQGIIGIVASRLAEKYKTPTIMISLDKGMGKGSCRSYGSFNMFDALTACSDYLLRFGGHAPAAGLSVEEGRLEEFKAAFSEYYRTNITNEPVYDVFTDILISDPNLLSIENISSLSLQEPYGTDNQKPVFCACGITVEKYRPLKGGKHCRFIASFGSGQKMDCIMFGHNIAEEGLLEGDSADIAFTPELNVFHSSTTVQLRILNIRPHDSEELCRLILEEGAPFSEAAAKYLPERADFAAVWRHITAKPGKGLCDIKKLYSVAATTGLKPETAAICLRVFYEVGLLCSDNNDIYNAAPANRGGKADLSAAPMMRAISKSL